MRKFENCKEAFQEIERDVIKFGRIVKPKTQQNMSVKDTKDWWTRELQCYSFMVIDDSDFLSQVKDPNWVIDEHNERVNMERPFYNPGTNYLKRKEYWNKYMNKEGKMDYSYNERMGPYLSTILSLLEEDPDTRRAILSIWDAKEDTYNIGKLKRVSCSMYYNLMIRDNAVDIIYHMRSCDVFEHFRNDFALACLFKHWITRILENMGKYYSIGYTFMVIDSLHAYKKDIESKGIVF